VCKLAAAPQSAAPAGRSSTPKADISTTVTCDADSLRGFGATYSRHVVIGVSRRRRQTVSRTSSQQSAIRTEARPITLDVMSHPVVHSHSITIAIEAVKVAIRTIRAAARLR
jgi:hypothetical protein